MKMPVPVGMRCLWKTSCPSLMQSFVVSEFVPDRLLDVDIEEVERGFVGFEDSEVE